MAEVSDRTISIGRILSRTFGVMGDNPLTVFGVALVLGALPQLLYTALAASSLSAANVPAFSLASLGASLLTMLIPMITGSLVIGCITRATVAYSQGHRATVGEGLSAALARLFPIIAVTLLSAFGIAFGMLLLAVPGIMLAIMWAVVVPVTVEEGSGIRAAFGRSRDLTRGARWRIFGLFLVVILILIALDAVTNLLSSLALGASYASAEIASTIPGIVFSLITSAIFTAIFSVSQTALYVELRDWKDGPAEAKLGEIFA